MDVNIHMQDAPLPLSLEKFAHKKLERLERYLPNIVDVRLELSKERTRRGEDLAVAQLTIRHYRGALLRTEERVQGDHEAAINQALDKMYTRISRFKGKVLTRKGRERFSATVEELSQAEAEPVPAATEIEYAAIEDAAAEPVIARHKVMELEPMTELEAVAQMELLGHSFFMFMNGETGLVNVLYRRSDNSYGVLIPSHA
ncbi:MAG: HPF/RaiA family ribosome-associated protein [Pleurocapsa minor GSE-CHR-MK-17-07R]|jgi:putative sigma-54 modulation protein|nr:HPF/RaiA family ribosome-associated protein [Pleurocapsa minor GSE-CHR-MK 17-07R]